MSNKTGEVNNSKERFEKVIDKDLLKRIVQAQSLPEEIVIDFLKCKSSLYNTDFVSRIVY
ncbi:MAG: hypothetical protein QY331_11055 [Melioribacteraceae bacterium]|nr:MAG: hypothetical protein QY331_11055 [Melioribacteraceae bacterium]